MVAELVEVLRAVSFFYYHAVPEPVEVLLTDREKGAADSIKNLPQLSKFLHPVAKNDTPLWYFCRGIKKNTYCKNLKCFEK